MSEFSRHEPWLFLVITLFFSVVFLRALNTPTGNVVGNAPQGTLVAPPRVIDHRIAWTPALKNSLPKTADGEWVYIRNGYYAFADGSYVSDADGNPIPATVNMPTGMVTGEEGRDANYYQPKLLWTRYYPILESCQDSDSTRGSIGNEVPTDGHNSYFQPGVVTLKVFRERMIGETVIAREEVKTVELQDRCFNAEDLGMSELPDYRGIVLEANCAALKSLKDARVLDALSRALIQDTEFNGGLSLLKNFYTAQFCQKAELTLTSGSVQNQIHYVGCGREGRQGYCL